MAVRISHASLNENGRVSGGVAGDQTGKEVCIRNWYSKPWSVLLRPNSAYADKIATAAEQGANNNNIGYDQNRRNTLNTQARNVGYVLKNIQLKCDCDCSSFATVCAQCAGINPAYSSGNAPTTTTMRARFVETGKFTALTESKYLTSDAYLKRGDILVKPGSHTVIVLDNGSKAGTSTTTNNTTTTKQTNTGIKGVQEWLNTYSANNIAVDGINGNNTKAATVKVLQTEINKQYGRNLDVDGIFGSITKALCPVVKRNAKGNITKSIQARLICLGYSVGSAGLDGDYGTSTETAVKTFQGDKGIERDGQTGKETFAKLFA